MAPDPNTSNHDRLTALSSFAARFPSTGPARDRPVGLSWGWLLLGTLAIVIAAIAIVAALLPRSVVVPECSRACDLTLTLQFPLPYPIDRTAHQAVLRQIGLIGRYPALIDDNSDLRSSLRAMGHKVAELTKDTQSSIDNDEIVAFSQQLSRTAADVTKITRLYSWLHNAYSKQMTTTAEASKALALTPFQRFAVRAAPWGLESLGLNMKKRLWDPWVDKQTEAQEARSGLAALNMEIKRLEWIDKVLQELTQKVHLLVTILDHWSDNYDHRSIQRPETAGWGWRRMNLWGKEVRDTRQDLIYRWNQKHIMHNGRLRDFWNERSTLITAGDEVIVIRVSKDWW